MKVISKDFTPENQVSMVVDTTDRPWFLAAQLADIFGHHDAEAMLTGIHTAHIVDHRQIGFTLNGFLKHFEFPERRGAQCMKLVSLDGVRALERRYSEMGIDKGLSEWIGKELLPSIPKRNSRYNVRQKSLIEATMTRIGVFVLHHGK